MMTMMVMMMVMMIMMMVMMVIMMMMVQFWLKLDLEMHTHCHNRGLPGENYCGCNPQLCTATHGDTVTVHMETQCNTALCHMETH